MEQAEILCLEGVTRQYSKSSSPAVNQVTFSLQQGDLLGLLGASGCGKTTLLRLIAGFERPETGNIMLNNERVVGKGVWVPPEKRDIGMVFQDYALFPHLTIAKNVAFGLTHQKQKFQQRLNSQQIRERIIESIKLVGLQGLENRYPHELSGGQQQRVALARALAPQPKLILLDEPLSNLDAQVRLRLREEIRAILKATGISAIFVTHDQEEALSISDWVAVMRQGQIEQFGPPEEIYQEPTSRFVAEFVTQANFLPAQFNGCTWETEVGSFTQVQTLTSNHHSQGNSSQESQALSNGDLMIRQEDLQVEPDDAGNVVVRDRQFLGREQRYCLQTPSGRELHARTTNRRVFPVGTRVKVSVSETALRIFPAKELA